jgi:sporulation protein YlmC with PRC-barrel domain
VANILTSFDALVDKKVICGKGFIIGEIKGANIDTKSWQIKDLYIELTDTAAEELGFKKRFRSSTVCLPTKFVKAVADVVTLLPSLDKLSESNEITECNE